MLKTILHLARSLSAVESHVSLRIGIILVLLSLNSAADLIGAASILPFTQLLVEPDSINESLLHQLGKRVLLTEIHSTYIIRFAIASIALIVLATVIRVKATKTMFSYVAKIEQLLSEKIVSTILRYDYEELGEISNGSLIKMATTDAEKTAQCVLLPILILYGQSVTAVIILNVMAYDSQSTTYIH